MAKLARSKLADVGCGARNDLELPMGKVKNWVTQLCMALKHVHKLRIVHRDVKGSNMFITGVAWHSLAADSMTWNCCHDLSPFLCECNNGVVMDSQSIPMV